MYGTVRKILQYRVKKPNVVLMHNIFKEANWDEEKVDFILQSVAQVTHTPTTVLV